MATKIETLRIVYSMVKNNPNPTAAIMQSSELVLRQTCPWDGVVKNLTELQEGGYVQMQQHSKAFVSITEKGYEYMSKYVEAYG